jgi:hypothetical protein
MRIFSSSKRRLSSASTSMVELAWNSQLDLGALAFRRQAR